MAVDYTKPYKPEGPKPGAEPKQGIKPEQGFHKEPVSESNAHHPEKPVPTSGVSLWQRLTAFLVDVTLLVSVIGLFSLSEVGDITVFSFFSPGYLEVLVLFIFLTLLEASGLGTTPGKMLSGLRIVDEKGGRPVLKQILIRNFIKMMSLWMFGVLLVFVLFNKDRRFLHDLMSRTRIVLK